MMPNFFKEMPKGFNEKGEWRLRVFHIGLMKDRIEYEEIHSGKKGVAYIRVRLRALLQDWKTLGSESGVGWSMRSAKTNPE